MSPSHIFGLAAGEGHDLLSAGEDAAAGVAGVEALRALAVADPDGVRVPHRVNRDALVPGAAYPMSRARGEKQQCEH